MIQLALDTTGLSAFVSDGELNDYTAALSAARQSIYEQTGPGREFLGWVHLPSRCEEDLLDRIEQGADHIRRRSDWVVVVGIGGSYLGTRAIAQALSPEEALPCALPCEPAASARSPRPHLVYAGHHLDAPYMRLLLERLNGVDYNLVVISKSGTTTEPAIAFRLLKKHLEEKYGRQEAASRIYVVTDAARGALKRLAEGEGYPAYVIPDDVGGRYSVLSPVGLLPLAAGGFDIRALMGGARDMEEHLLADPSLEGNPALLYAAIRNLLYKKGKTTEILATYTPSLFYLSEWWKQLYGESEGKNHRGIFPAAAGFTTDLHSLGQYIQEGLRNLFETHLLVTRPGLGMPIPHDPDDADGLNYLAGRCMSEVNARAAEGTMAAHVEGGVPVLGIRLQELTERSLGETLYFFEMACALSGYLLGVNPFDQPGVEAYKQKMFSLLGKPGS